MSESVPSSPENIMRVEQQIGRTYTAGEYPEVPTFEEAQVARAVREAEAVGPGGIDRGSRREGSEADEERMRLLYGSERARGSAFLEGLRTTENPQTLTLMARDIMAGWEELPRFFNGYAAQSNIGILTDRVNAYRRLATLPPDVRKELQLDDFLHTKLEGPQLQEFLQTIEGVRDEVVARATVLEVYQQQLQMAGDTKSYAFQFFIAPWRIKTEAKHYRAIFNAGPTLKGSENFGDLVEEALQGKFDIAEGLAVDPDTGKKINNPYDDDVFTETQIIENTDYLAKTRTRGDTQAIILADELFRHWDAHVDYATTGGQINARTNEILCAIGKVDSSVEARDKMGRVKTSKRRLPDGREIGEPVMVGDVLVEPYKKLIKQREEEFQDLAVEASDTTNDTAKPTALAVRQLAEFTKSHPRAVAAPATLGCFPNLTMSLPRMLALAEIDPTKQDHELGTIKLWDEWRARRLKMKDFPWDQSEFKYNGKTYRGIAKMVHHVPYGLQAMYSCGKVYESIMRDDFAKAGAEIIDPGYLHGLNKGYELAFIIMLGSSGLDYETIVKLRQLTKVNMLAGYAVANTSYDVPKTGSKYIDHLKVTMVPRQAVVSDTGIYLSRINAAATTAGFFSETDRVAEKTVKLNGVDTKETLYEKEKKLLETIVKNRRLGVKPSLLVGDWFTQEEIDKMNELGVYAPFKC